MRVRKGEGRKKKWTARWRGVKILMENRKKILKILEEVNEVV